MIKVSDYIINFFENKNVDTAFTVSGGGCIHLIDSLRKSKKIETYCVHHEQSALMASEGYTRETGNLSLNIVTTGPGGTNAITGLLGMWLDSIPGIIISGQVPMSQLSKGTGCRQIGDQEFDIIKTVESCTKYCLTITNASDLPKELEKAYQIATTGRPGPVWIDVPLDIQGSYIEDTTYDNEFCVANEEIDKTEISEFIQLISESKKPLIIAGNGIRLANSYNELNEWLINSNIPIVTGPHSGVDVVDNSYEYYAGRIGILGQITSNQIIQEADLLIIIGSRCPVKMTGYNINEFSPKSKKIIIDIDENEIAKHKFSIDLKINKDLKSFLKIVNNIDLNLSISNWQRFVIDTRSNQIYYYPKHYNLQDYMSMYYFTYVLKNYLDDQSIITSNGTAHVVPLQMLRLNKNQRLFTNVGCASMGYGLPASIGACIGRKKQVLCFEGDGSIMMNLQELQTAKHHNLPIVIFIINNDGYLSIKMTQESFFEGNMFASGSNNGVTLPDYEKIASAFGIKYFSIKNNQEIEAKLKEIISLDQLCIVELFCHPNEKHEPKVMSKGIDENGRIIPGSLTDMAITEGF
jgi:acetolactate synthase-1/2/3 large subunit